MSIFSLEVIFLSMMKLNVFKDQKVVGYIGLSCESKKNLVILWGWGWGRQSSSTPSRFAKRKGRRLGL